VESFLLTAVPKLPNIVDVVMTTQTGDAMSGNPNLGENMAPERAAIIRAQNHGWKVSFVDANIIIMERYWIEHGRRHILFVRPDGRITARTEAA
jgi:hypothetical protein